MVLWARERMVRMEGCCFDVGVLVEWGMGCVGKLLSGI